MDIPLWGILVFVLAALVVLQYLPKGGIISRGRLRTPAARSAVWSAIQRNKPYHIVAAAGGDPVDWLSGKRGVQGRDLH